MRPVQILDPARLRAIGLAVLTSVAISTAACVAPGAGAVPGGAPHPVACPAGGHNCRETKPAQVAGPIRSRAPHYAKRPAPIVTDTPEVKVRRPTGGGVQ